MNHPIITTRRARRVLCFIAAAGSLVACQAQDAGPDPVDDAEPRFGPPIIDHGDGLQSLYAHNSSLLVDKGQWVRGGEKIARVGRSGNASTSSCRLA